MAIQTMDSLLYGLEIGKRINIYKTSATTEGAGTFHSLLKVTGFPIAGNTPPTGSGEIATKATVGAFDFVNPATGKKKYIGRANVAGSTLGSLIIYDRLWHNSGLVANITTSQAVNSTTLTRFTDGSGVEIWGEVYTATGATGSAFSVTYTDGANTSKIATYAHPANALTAGQMFPFVFPSGAVGGVKSIQSLSLTPSTGTAGNFGLVLVRRLAEIPITIVNIATVMDAFSLGLPEITNDACLCMVWNCTATNSGNIIGTIDIIEG